MRRFQIIGLRSENQAKRVVRRFNDAIGQKDVEIDFSHSTINLPPGVDEYTISLISSFEQVSIIDENIAGTYNLEEDNHHHHHHEIKMGDSHTAQRNMLIVFFLNLFFSISEFIFGSIFNSQAILSDAVHDLGDALSIGLAYLFEKISNKGSSNEYSYGYRRFSLLGALITSVVLLIGAILVIINTVPILFNPRPVNHQGVFWVAIVAIIINGFSVWLMSKGQSANEKLLNIHLFEDLFGWIAVLIMSIILRFTEWYFLDPLLSLAIAGWILTVTIPEFLRISKIFLQAIPENVDSKELLARVQEVENVKMISHFHIWSTDGQQHMMTLTATTDVSSKKNHEELKLNIRKVATEFNITHLTIEVLYDPNNIIKDNTSCEG